MSFINQWFVDVMQRLGEGIVAVIGSNCEFVVHDFTDPEHSIVVIAGDVTGRSIGGPVPDLDYLNKLNNESTDRHNFRTKIGDRQLQSCSVWIRDENGNIIGEVGINMDFSNLIKAKELIDKSMPLTIPTEEMELVDTFAKDIDDLVKFAINDFMKRNEIQDLDSMSQADKLSLVSELEDLGLFRVRGVVNHVAEILDVSRATIYNYRASIKNHQP